MSTTDGASSSSGGPSIVEWEPQVALMECSDNEVLFSRGFLRCKPEKWFPGLSAHWTPVSHAFDVDLLVKNITPTFSLPKDNGHLYRSTLNGHPVTLFMEKGEAEVLFDTLLPRSRRQAKEVAMDYFARRFVVSLARSWSGRDEIRATYHGEVSSETIRDAEAAIVLKLRVNSIDCEVSILISKEHIELLDGMWRRQTNSFQPVQGDKKVRVQVTELAVPRDLLADYTQSGAIIDLETQENNTAVVLRGTQKWCRAELYRYNELLVLSMQDDIAGERTSLPEDTVAVSIELGEFDGDPATLAEFSQSGAMMQTPLRLSSRVQMRVGDEIQCRGTLGVYQGRFAVTVD